MTLASLAILNPSSASAAAFITGQSESLPIKIPTSGLAFGLFDIVGAEN
jgi:hypothetical protein